MMLVSPTGSGVHYKICLALQSQGFRLFAAVSPHVLCMGNERPRALSTSHAGSLVVALLGECIGRLNQHGAAHGRGRCQC